MNINAVIDMLNKEFGTNIDGSYYAYVSEWRDWWAGKFKPFHEFREWSGDGETGKLITRELYSMRMGKKVCEDWASILLNEKTEIVVEDKASSDFLQGEDGMAGVLGANDFWTNGNALIERSFATGTGAAVLRVQDIAVTKRGDVVPPYGMARWWMLHLSPRSWSMENTISTWKRMCLIMGATAFKTATMRRMKAHSARQSCRKA